MEIANIPTEKIIASGTWIVVAGGVVPDDATQITVDAGAPSKIVPIPKPGGGCRVLFTDWPEG